MSSNQHLLDAVTRHQVFIQRYAGSEVKKAHGYLRGMLKRIRAEMANANTEFQRGRLVMLANHIERIISEASQDYAQQLALALDDFAEYEGEFALKLLEGAVTVNTVAPAPAQVIAALTKKPMILIQGKGEARLTLDELVKVFSDAQARQVAQVVKDGAIMGETVDQMTRKISELVNTRGKREIEAVVRTAVNHIGTEARSATYDANADILAGEKYTATLDSRTTVNCASLDGKVYPLGKGPTPPLHYNCRSVRTPVVKDEFQIPGIKGKRASMDGPVDSRTTYNSWLKRQPAGFQDEVLGAERGALFRRGGLSLSKFTDDSGKLYDLDTLKRMEPLAFEKAFIPITKAPISPAFKPARSIAEAEKFVLDNKLAEQVSWKGMDLEVANQSNQSLHYHVERFPELRKVTAYIGSGQEQARRAYTYDVDYFRSRYLERGMSPEGAEKYAKRSAKRQKIPGEVWAHSWGHPGAKGIGINEKFGKSKGILTLKKGLQDSLESKFHPVGCDTIKSVLDHEFGHELDRLLGIRQNDKMKAIFSAEVNIADNLSKYGSKNIAEFIAEGWTEYLNNPNPRRLAKTIGEFIENEYARRYKK